MQDKGSIKLFQDLHLLLDTFVKNSRADHTELSKTEEACLTKLGTIVSELDGFLKDTSPEKFTIPKYEAFILRLISLTPAETIKTKKSGGFLGIIGASETQEKTAGWLTTTLTRLTNQLEEKLKEEKKKANKEAKITSEKSSRSETKPEEKTPSSSEIEEIKNQLAALSKQVSMSNERIAEAYESGKKEGQKEAQQQLISYVKQHIGQYFNAEQQQKVFLLLEGAPGTTPIVPPLVPAPEFIPLWKKEEGPVVKDEEEKAKQWIGEAKFAVVKQLVTIHNAKNTSNDEKRLARWTIFELMIHKYDQAISDVFENIKSILSTRCNRNITEFPNLTPVFNKTYAQETISTKKLSAEELTTFYQLVSTDEGYLPKDGTASNHFGSMAEKAKGNNVSVITITEENYITNAVKNLTPKTNAASVPGNAFS